VQQDVPSGMHDQWPETLAVYHAIAHVGDQTVVSDLIGYLLAQRVERDIPKGLRVWQNQMASLAGRNGHILIQRPDVKLEDASDLTQWIPFSRARARSRGPGLPTLHWSRLGERVDKISGHDEDYLYFRSPLTGDYDFECDLSSSSSQVLLGGIVLGNASDPSQIVEGSMRVGTKSVVIPFRFSHLGQWVHYRSEVRDGICRTFLDSHLVRTSELPRHHDPWVGLRSWARSHSSIRDVRIFGNPVIPDRVLMSGNADLTGWIPYHDDAVAARDAQWQFQDDPESSGQIVGQRWQDYSGMSRQSLLSYQRPLDRKGTVTYDFYYQPGSVITHPALDRLAFLLNPDGVRIHWVTDHLYDPGHVAPDNESIEPSSRRGPAMLPLEIDAWNTMQVAVNGPLVSLTLNNVLIYERALEPANHRTFGLFHYVDASQIRVRNVTMTGDWPTSLPSVPEQELASHEVDKLDQGLANLTSVFKHDFAEGGLPVEFFSTGVGPTGRVRSVAAGVTVSMATTGPWTATDVRLPFTVHGDFDVETAFDAKQMQSDKDACIMLAVHLDDEKQHELRLMRMQTTALRQEVHASFSTLHADGGRSYISGAQVPVQTLSGRLRLARRGENVYYLFAENDSPQYRLMGVEKLTDKPSRADGVQLRVLGNGIGQTEVTWKNITLRAHRMTLGLSGQSPPRSLYIMNHDGTDLRDLASPVKGFRHLGSPEWSVGDRKLVGDMTKGGTTTSHLFSMNPDASEFTDLGPGCMPSLSPDGLELVFSDPQAGIVRMKLDGSERQTIESSGWGTQWSPDGRYIAWVSGNNITLLDTKSNKRRELLTAAQASTSSSIYWNMGWSHDSQWLAFKTQLADSPDDVVAVASVSSSDRYKIIFQGPNHVNEDFTWHPDSKHVTCAMIVPPSNRLKLVKLNRETPGAPEILPGQPEEWTMLDSDWSSDGKHIIFAAQRPPQPREWPLEEE
jgi:Tol biopolymer transport system component